MSSNAINLYQVTACAEAAVKTDTANPTNNKPNSLNITLTILF